MPDCQPRGVGRPSTGLPIHTRVPASILAKVDAYATEHNISRAEALRRLLTGAVCRWENR